MEYSDLADPLWRLFDEIVERLQSSAKGQLDVRAELLHIMRDTDGSLRELLKALQDKEKSGTSTGRWSDVRLLPRAQFERLFILLYLVHGQAEAMLQYQRAAWASHWIYLKYEEHRHALPGESKDWIDSQLRQAAASAKSLGIAQEDADETWRAASGGPPVAGLPKKPKQIQPLPTPGKMILDNRLAGSRFEALAHLLYLPWKMECDFVHTGMRALSLGRNFRTRKTPISQGGPSVEYQAAVLDKTLVQSMVLLLTALTVSALEWMPQEHLLLNRCTKIWDRYRQGMDFAVVLWDGTVKNLMGVLGP